MKKVLITTSSYGDNDIQSLELLEKRGFSVILNPFKRKLTENEVLELLEEHKPDALIAGVEPLTQNVLKQASSYLRIISRCGIGLDSVDVAAAKDLNIQVCNTPDAPTRPVAELTLGLILNLLRKISISDNSIKKGEWERPMGNLLYKKTIGIVGCGRIGSCLAKLLEPFECRILGNDPFIRQHPVISMVSKEELLSASDLITLHIPYTQENRHFINEEALKMMRPDSFLINAARGGLIDENALIKALQQGNLAGVALDCFEEEPYSGELRSLNNVVLTAHIGSYAKEARIFQEIQSSENVINYFEEQNEI